MGRKRIFTKMVSGEEKRQPGLRITMKGKYQMDYLALYRIAETHFKVPGTTLGRMIISDFVKKWREEEKKHGGGKTQQMVLILKGAKSQSPKTEVK